MTRTQARCRQRISRPRAGPPSSSPEKSSTTEIRLRRYPKGTFIYRLSGRNRENSASYYTPEPLARTLVKYALKELLEGKKADEILKLKVIEPAMGSAAFLVEVVNQLTDKYLELKQTELDRRIPHEERADVERRVRAYIADRNVFGVDLNPIAVELGQISLWLNCLHKGGHAPWFDDQVHNGNSLVGARRAVFPAASLSARREDDRWHKRKPREIGWSGEAREADEVWHFLLPDPGMSSYDQDIVRPLAPEAWTEFAQWRREFMGPLEPVEVENLLCISRVVDQLFEDVADRLAEMRLSVNDDFAIWPAKPSETEKHADFSDKIKRLEAFHGDGLHNAVAWKRLRTAMDAWCALWVWPIDKAALLPSRASFIVDLALVLEGRMGGSIPTAANLAARPVQGTLFETVMVPGRKNSGALFAPEERAVVLERKDLFGDVDVEELVAASSWLPTAIEVAKKRRFMHYDLEFADVMRERRGFDLVIGNPPWIKPAWVDGDVLSEIEPKYGIRNASASDVEKGKLALLGSSAGLREWYLDSYAETGGLQAFLSSHTSYPFLSGGQPNLYKCFIDLAFRITAKSGIAALIHQDNHLSDPDGQSLRQSWYRRISRHYNFINSITSKMFAEVSHRKTYSLNVYSGDEHEVGFEHASTLLLPGMVDDSYAHDGVGPVPGLRNASGEWDTRGHRKRIVRVDGDVLRNFARVIEEGNTPPEHTRFLFPFSQDTLSILATLAKTEMSLADAAQPFQMKRLWDESVATKKDHILSSHIGFPATPQECILTGSLIYVGNPFYKCPSSTGRAEPEIDLELIDPSYRARNYYRRISTVEVYNKGIPPLGWDKATKHTDKYRIAFRNMLSPPTERTLIAALIPPNVAHVNTIESMAFADDLKLLQALPLWLSLPFDFLVKVTGQTHFRESSLRSFPWALVSETAQLHALRLSCLTSDYADLWNKYARQLGVSKLWASNDERLASDDPQHAVRQPWSSTSGLRSDFARRQALVEIDVLVAQALGLTVEQLIEMYRTQFHVLNENERGTWYDMNGRIVWTCSKGLSGIGYKKKDGKKPTAKEWLETYANLADGSVLECEVDIDFLPSGPQKIKRTYVAPFLTCDREADYRRAWAFFEAHTEKKAA